MGGAHALWREGWYNILAENITIKPAYKMSFEIM